jgi:hypothetical protein
MTKLYKRSIRLIKEGEPHARNKPTVISRETFEERLKYRFPHIKCLSYYSNHRTAWFKCKNCDNKWQTTPYEVLGLKYGCPFCGQKIANNEKIEKNAESFVKRLDRKDITILGKYKGAYEPIETKCNNCKNIWYPRANNLLNARSGCPRCANTTPRQGRSNIKFIQIGKRKVKVQGSEDVVIEWLLKKVKGKDIVASSEKGVPTIKYRYKGMDRKYYPDLLVKNTIVEVKSTWTLFDFWKSNISKARACFRQKYKYRLIVVIGKNCIILPKDWYKHSILEVKNFLKRKSDKEFIVMGLDPGPVNFGWSVVKGSRPFKIEVLASGMLKNTINKMPNETISNEDSDPFMNEVEDIIYKYKVQRVVVERFMSRGLKGSTIECVNGMIGLIWGGLPYLSRLKLIIPAQWKNAWNKHIDLKDFYKRTACKNHQVDATGIAMYGIYNWMGYKPFFNIEQIKKELAKQITQTSNEPLIRGRPGYIEASRENKHAQTD